ncbi:MAG: acetylxylan esterase [Planctomycetaceae bacterium]|nr:acetylxylan esterase [Planctomycetaceae bacterium]
MRNRMMFDPCLVVFLFIGLASPLLAQEFVFDGRVLTPTNGYEVAPKDMMRTWLLGEIESARLGWQSEYDSLKTVDDVQAYQQVRKQFFAEQLGLASPDNILQPTPLNARVTKTLTNGTPGKDAYRVEMVVFESAPGFYVSGAVFLPDETRFQPPYPAVLVVCGHSTTGKAYELYQRVPALAATNGLIAMSIDPIDQGERSQRLTADGKPVAQGVPAHNVIGASSILLGRNAATFEVWDMTRALDYLQSRPDVDAKRIGVTGTSGGGTQTSYIMALDPRVKVAVPSCYLCGLYDKLTTDPGPQDAEQNIFSQLNFSGGPDFAGGLDHVDYCIMRAPFPTLMETATGDYFHPDNTWKSYRHVKRVYDRFGYADKMSLIETDGPHGWHKNLREASIRWMLRWMAGRDEQIFEADDMPIFDDNEFRATPQGEVMLLEGARSAFDLNRDCNDHLAAIRENRDPNVTDEELAGQIRSVIRSRFSRESVPDRPRILKQLNNIPPSLAEVTSRVTAETVTVEDGKIPLPMIRFMPKSDVQGAVIYLNDAGKTADLPRIESLLREGKAVLAVDLRGMGETQAVGATYFNHKQFGTDGTDFYLAYLLGKTYIGMRTDDLLTIANIRVGSPFDVIASGEMSGLIALHAKALEPSLIGTVTLETPLRSWYEVVREGDAPYPITNLVHGALRFYDIPDLERLAFANRTITP